MEYKHPNLQLVIHALKDLFLIPLGLVIYVLNFVKHAKLMEHVGLAKVGDIYLVEIVFDVGRNVLNAVSWEEIVHHVLLHSLKLDKHVFFVLMLAKHAKLKMYLNA